MKWLFTIYASLWPCFCRFLLIIRLRCNFCTGFNHVMQWFNFFFFIMLNLILFFQSASTGPKHNKKKIISTNLFVIVQHPIGRLWGECPQELPSVRQWVVVGFGGSLRLDGSYGGGSIRSYSCGHRRSLQHYGSRSIRYGVDWIWVFFALAKFAETKLPCSANLFATTPCIYGAKYNF